MKREYKGMIIKTKVHLDMKSLFKFALLCIAYLNCSIASFGQENTVEWKKDTTISGTPEYFDLLIIYPGVTVTFDNHTAKLIIYGSVVAIGTEKKPIIFKGLDNQLWKGIDIIGGTAPSEFEYCEFYNIKRNYKNRVERYRQKAGIDISYTDNVKLKNCFFSNNEDGIGVINSSNLIIDSCNFRTNDIKSSEKGLVTFELNTSAKIINTSFIINKCTQNGLIKIINGCDVQLLNNKFHLTKFTYLDNQPPFFPLIFSESYDYANFIVINGNKFVGTNAETNEIPINEIKIKGIIEQIDSTNVFIWNNEFKNNPFAGYDRRITNIDGVNANLTIAHNDFKDYTNHCINVDYCDTKITLNHFESNQTTGGVIRFGSYQSETLEEDIHNEIIGNVFVNNNIVGEIGGVISSKIWPRININLTTLIENNYFFNNISYYVDSKNILSFNGGAAIYDMNNSFVTIQNNTFEQDSAFSGGAIAITNQINSDVEGLAIIKENEFVNNWADSLGGAIYVDSAAVNIDDNSILYNSAQNGGGIFAEYTKTSIIKNNAIQNNKAEKGAGIYLYKSYSNGNPDESIDTINLTDNRIEFNKYSVDGGGIYIDKFEENTDTLKLMRNMISRNSGQFGFEDLRGGGIFIYESKNIKMYNCNFFSNTAGYEKACIYVYSGDQSSLSLINCDIINHDNEGGIFFSQNSNPECISIYNTLFSGNNINATGKSIMYNNSDSLKTYNCYFDLLPVNYKVKNIDYVQAIVPGFVSTSDFRLKQNNSICIDSGNIAEIYNDIPSGDTVRFPSWGTQRNDIGITGGPFAFDKDFLFVPQDPETNLIFTIKDIDPTQRRVKIILNENTSKIADRFQQYRILFGDGNFTEYLEFQGNEDIEHVYNKSTKKAIITLLINNDGNINAITRKVSFTDLLKSESFTSNSTNSTLKHTETGTETNCCSEVILSIYPNPTNDLVHINNLSSSSIQSYTFDLFDIHGNKIIRIDLSGVDNPQTINLGQYGKGLFIIKITLDGNTQIKKVLVN